MRDQSNAWAVRSLVIFQSPPAKSNALLSRVPPVAPNPV